MRLLKSQRRPPTAILSGTTFEAECTRTGQWERFVNDMRVAVRYCASHKLYVRQQNCASADWLARNPHLHESLCPTYRTW